MSDSLGDLKPEDIPKEELLHLCMKMNKRMQAMESKGKELLKKRNQLQLERSKLLSLMETTLNYSFHMTNDQDLDLNNIEKIWNEWDINRMTKLKEYERQIQELKETLPTTNSSNPADVNHPTIQPNISSTTVPSLSKTNSIKGESEGNLLPPPPIVDSVIDKTLLTRLEIEIEKLKNHENQLKESLKTLETKFQEKSNESDSLRKENELIKNNFEEKIVFIQMQQQQQKQYYEGKLSDYSVMKAEHDKMKVKVEEKEILLNSNKEMLVSLQARLIELEPELSISKDKITDLERRLSSLQLLKYESDNLITSLKNDLKTISIEKEKISHKLKELEENKLRSDSLNSKIIALNEEINKLKEENDEKSSTIIRLRSEISINEKNHAIKVAMLATSEATNKEFQKTIELKENEIKELIQRISDMQINYSTLEESLKAKAKEMDSAVSAVEFKMSAEKEEYDKLVASLKVANDELIDSMKKDFNKKSAMARTLLTEREEEVRNLTQKVQQLQDEISSGAPTERKIFELAEVQSKRETMHGLHRDTRELAFQQLQSALASKDFELAQCQQLLGELSGEINELRKIKQREGINMDYLKNIVFQYMTFPINSSERNALIPVLAMLLQFSPKEMMEIQKSVREPIFGNRPIKEVKRIDFSGRPPSSATTPPQAVPRSLISQTPVKPAPSPQSQPQSSSSKTEVVNNSESAKLKIVPVNQDFFIQNEHLANSKEFPSMSFDLNSPLYHSQMMHQSQMKNKLQANMDGNIANNNHSNNPLAERKDSDYSENDYELRQKLKTIPSDTLDLSLSEDQQQNNGLNKNYVIAQNLLGGGSRNASSSQLPIQLSSSSSQQLETPPAGMSQKSNTNNGETKAKEGIKTTISGTSIDEQVFVTSSKAL